VRRDFVVIVAALKVLLERVRERASRAIKGLRSPVFSSAISPQACLIAQL